MIVYLLFSRLHTSWFFFPFLFLKKHGKIHQHVPFTRGSMWRKRSRSLQDQCDFSSLPADQARGGWGEYILSDIVKGKGKILVMEQGTRSRFSLYFQTINLQAGCLMCCSHLKALLTWAVSCKLSTNMVAESEVLSSKKCQVLPVSRCCRYPNLFSRKAAKKYMFCLLPGFSSGLLV